MSKPTTLSFPKRSISHATFAFPALQRCCFLFTAPTQESTGAQPAQEPPTSISPATISGHQWDFGAQSTRLKAVFFLNGFLHTFNYLVELEPLQVKESLF